MLPFAGRGADKALAGLGMYTLFVLLEAPLGTAGCLAAEAVIMSAVLLHRWKSSTEEISASKDSKAAPIENSPEGSGDSHDQSDGSDAGTGSNADGSPAKGKRRSAKRQGQAAQPAAGAQQPSLGAEVAGGTRAPAASLRPTAGSWAAQAAERRRQQEASAGSRAAPTAPVGAGGDSAKGGRAAAATRAPAGGRAAATAAPALKSSAQSWAAQQRKRRSESGGAEPGDAELARSVKSILNKLTVEKFDSLYTKLVACGITTNAHMEILVGEIVEKARAQHHFVNMYAELCARLGGEFSALPEVNFKRVLLDHCQMSLETSLEPMAETARQGDEANEEQAKHKERLLGSIKLTGELLVRQMLSSKILIACAEDLLETPAADRLECLAVLLTATGPTFDDPRWGQHAALNSVFAAVGELSEASSVPSRVRCLLKDVLDLRAGGWVNSKAATRAEGPKRLEEVHREAAAECVFIDKPKKEWEPRAEGGKAAGASHEEDWRAQQVPQKEKQAPSPKAGWRGKQASNPKYCRYGRGCQRKDCSFEHPEGRATAA